MTDPLPEALPKTFAFRIERLAAALHATAPLTIAVSGGVDSMTLASFAQRTLSRGMVKMAHATSPAVPADALPRIERLATRENWDFAIIDAGEFADPNYRANPVDRCYFCKTNLYARLRGLVEGAIASGANRDDLADYRPGLVAARQHGVIHPFVEAAMTKHDVRRLARRLGHDDLAELPASPCLSSRVETGIAISEPDLERIDRIESWLKTHLRPNTVRCRLRANGLVIELDAETLARVTTDAIAELHERLHRDLPDTQAYALSIAPYRRGSAFIGARPCTDDGQAEQTR